jgi:hypothetical protein
MDEFEEIVLLAGQHRWARYPGIRRNKA